MKARLLLSLAVIAGVSLVQSGLMNARNAKRVNGGQDVDPRASADNDKLKFDGHSYIH